MEIPFRSGTIDGGRSQGWEEKGLSHLCLAYIISAIVGIGIIILMAIVIGKLLAKKDD